MSLKSLGMSAIVRAVAATSALALTSLGATHVAAQVTETQQAAALAASIETAVRDTLAQTTGLSAEDQAAAVEQAIQAVIQSSNVSPAVAAVALSTAQRNLAAAGVTSPAVATAFANTQQAVQLAQGAPVTGALGAGSSDGAPPPVGAPPPSGGGGGGGGTTYP